MNVDGVRAHESILYIFHCNSKLRTDLYFSCIFAFYITIVLIPHALFRLDHSTILPSFVLFEVGVSEVENANCSEFIDGSQIWFVLDGVQMMLWRRQQKVGQLTVNSYLRRVPANQHKEHRRSVNALMESRRMPIRVQDVVHFDPSF